MIYICKEIKTKYMDNKIIKNFVDYCNNHLDFSIESPRGYHSAPICVLDSVFSIGVKYTSVCNVLTRFCAGFGLEFSGQGRNIVVSTSITTTEMLDKMKKKHIDANVLAKDYTNTQRTSSKNGILKADAYIQFLRVLKKHGVDTVGDIRKQCGNLDFENEIKSIKGLSSGITIDYMYILAGIDDYVKVDRHIKNFCEEATSMQNLSKDNIVSLIRDSVVLQTSWPNNINMTPRHLDHIIWVYQSNNSQ